MMKRVVMAVVVLASAQHCFGAGKEADTTKVVFPTLSAKTKEALCHNLDFFIGCTKISGVPKDTGIVPICARLKKKVDDNTFETDVAAKILAVVYEDSVCAEGLRVAKSLSCKQSVSAESKTEKKDISDKSSRKRIDEIAWDVFRKRGANRIADYVEEQTAKLGTKVTFNRSAKDASSFATLNKHIDSASESAKWVEASTLALFALQQIQEDATTKKPSA
jgi:hypothetical protein